MPSSFMVKRNYAHCPLKKRPLALYNEPASAPEQEEPEDLSVKRPRLSSPPPPEAKTYTQLSPAIQHPVARATAFSPVEPSRIHTVSPVYSNFPRVQPLHPQPTAIQHPGNPIPAPQSYFYNHPPPNLVSPTPVKATSPIAFGMGGSPSLRSQPQQPPRSQENLPTLAEYYLQLFKATSEAEAKKKEAPQPLPPPTTPWQSAPTTYLPLSPQTSPINHHETPEGASFAPRQAVPPSPFYAPAMPAYPDSSALISPVSTCSSANSESEDEAQTPHQAPAARAARYACESCGKSYSTQSGLRKHSELHCASLGARAFECKHCAKAYTSVGALKMHIRTHTLPCKCHVCGKAFSRPWLLQGHIRTHTGEKPFECNQCHRSFADRSNLRAHLQTHERVKKYACNTCNKTFSRMSLLNKHSENACMGLRFTGQTAQTSPEPLSPISQQA